MPLSLWLICRIFSISPRRPLLPLRSIFENPQKYLFLPSLDSLCFYLTLLLPPSPFLSAREESTVLLCYPPLFIASFFLLSFPLLPIFLASVLALQTLLGDSEKSISISFLFLPHEPVTSSPLLHQRFNNTSAFHAFSLFFLLVCPYSFTSF